MTLSDSDLIARTWEDEVDEETENSLYLEVERIEMNDMDHDILLYISCPVLSCPEAKLPLASEMSEIPSRMMSMMKNITDQPL